MDYSLITCNLPLTPMKWKHSQQLTDYQAAMEAMETRVDDIIAGHAPEMVWLLEHPPLYTAGTSARAGDLLDNQRFDVYQTGRGGQFTYHGPGQRVAYIMLDLKKRNAMDVRAYVQNLEQWLIATLKHFGVEGFVREGRVGVWVEDSGKTIYPLNPESRILNPEKKIAALGIRIRKWVTYHGVSLNVSPDLSHYAGIVPCGIGEFGVTSLAALGVDVEMKEVDAALKASFEKLFL